MFLKKLKIGKWWHYKIPPLLSISYLLLAYSKESININILIIHVFCFLIAVIGTAAYGHIINDCFDIEQDKKAGKYNAFAGLSLPKRWLTILILLFIAILPWFYLPTNSLTISLLALQFLILTIYAVPPFRFKERALLGVFSDALYAYVIPFGVAFSTFSLLTKTSKTDFKFIIFSMAFWYLILGIRSIVFHQIQDFENDLKSDITTWAIKKGKAKAYHFLKKIALPLEVISFFVVLFVLSFKIQYFYFLYIFIFYLFYKFFILKYAKSKNHFNLRNEDFIQRYFYDYLNDFYEKWLPLCFLLLIVIENPNYYILAAAHIVLFKNAISDFLLEGSSDLRIIKKRFGIKEQWQHHQMPLIMTAIFFIFWQYEIINSSTAILPIIYKIINVILAFIVTWFWSYCVLEKLNNWKREEYKVFYFAAMLGISSLLSTLLWQKLITDNQQFIITFFYYLAIITYALLSFQKQQSHIVGYLLSIFKGLIIPIIIIIYLFHNNFVFIENSILYTLIFCWLCLYSLRNVFYEQILLCFYEPNKVPFLDKNRLQKYFSVILISEIISFASIVLYLQNMWLCFFSIFFLVFHTIKLKFLWHKTIHIMQASCEPIHNFSPLKQYIGQNIWSSLYVSIFYFRYLPLFFLISMLLNQSNVFLLFVFYFLFFRNFITDFFLEDIDVLFQEN